MMNRTFAARIIAIALFVIGGLFIAAQFFTNAGNSLRALSLVGRVEHPASYVFPIYQTTLQAYVHNGRVNYSELKNSKLLPSALQQIEVISPARMSKPAALAFWLNVYNLLNLERITSNYPIKNTDQLPRSLSQRRYIVGGESYNIEEIDQEQIRPLARAINVQAIFLKCNGTLGYPRLVDHVITTESLSNDAGQSLIEFVSSPHTCLIDREKHLFLASQFFKWNEDIFSGNSDSVFSFVNAQLPERKRLTEEEQQTFHYEYFPGFNWNINDRSGREQTTKEAK